MTVASTIRRVDPDPHTFFIPAQVVTESFSDEAAVQAAVPDGGLLEGRFALLRLPKTTGIDTADQAYVHAGARWVAELDAHRPAGWIVDLRGNTSGNMFPMLTVVAPLLGEGHLGSFIDGDGVVVARWELADGDVTATAA